MKILTRQGSLRTELFKEVMLHERLGIIALNYSYRYEEDGEQATEYTVQIPLTFRSRRRARQAFKAYLRARNTGKESVSLLGFSCRWPQRAYRKIISDKNHTLSEL